MKRLGCMIGIGALVLALLVVATIAVLQHRKAEAAQQQLGLDAARVLSAVFSRTEQLRVARLSGEVVAKSAYDGTVFHSEQETRAPYAVSYVVDLGALRASDYRWDEQRKRMTVLIPDVAAEPPRVDLSQARVTQHGMWISRDASIDLQRQAAGRLQAKAAQKASEAANMAKARAAAKAAVERLVGQPLAAAGLEVTVAVVFPWEGQPSTEQWDRSRSLEDVAANRF